MTDDTPSTKAPPIEPTPAAATTFPEESSTDDNDAVALGRPTPSPEQILSETASSSKPNSSSPLVCRDVEIGGPFIDDITPDDKQDDASGSNDSKAETNDADDDAYHLLPQMASSEMFDSSSPPACGHVEITGQPIDDTTSDGNQDGASSPNDKATKEASSNDTDNSFVTTPLNFKNQVAALVGADVSSEKKQGSIFEAMTKQEEEYHEDMKFSPSRDRLSTPTDPNVGSSGDFLMSNFRTDGLFPGSMMETPDPLLADANVNDLNLLNSEVMAAASTASAMLYRSDGFEPGVLLPQFATDSSGMMNGATATTSTPGGGFDMSQFAQYPMSDAFPLPPYMQAHLDETYAASTVVFPHNPNGADSGYGNTTSNGNVFIQVTAYRKKRNGRTPGRTPPAVSRSSQYGRFGEAEKNMGRGKTFAQMGQVPFQPAAADAKKKKGHTRPRPLPLRKRKLQINFDDEEYKPVAAIGRKKALVRHNMKSEGDDSRITCKCSKSKCLKLYCDCFQQRQLCSSECECRGCKNTEENSGPNGVRTKAIEQVLARRPDAFEPRTRDADEGCRCKKNRCLKKYCICFNQGNKCDSRCRCKNCENQPAYDDAEEEAVGTEIVVQPPTQYVEATPKCVPVPVSSIKSVGTEIMVQPPTQYVEATPKCVPVPVSSIKCAPEQELCSSALFDALVYQEPPTLPGGYSFGIDSPPAALSSIMEI